MRLLMKRNLLKTLDIIKEAQKAVFSNQLSVGEDIGEVLAYLQELAQRMGNMLEGELDGHRQMTRWLEEYCEYVYQVSLYTMERSIPNILEEKMDEILGHLYREIMEIELQIDIVFLPYKYSMWDSLESIWRAADQDQRCRCRVVPIPYYDRMPDGSLGEMHYEGDRFPRETEIIDYKLYDIKKELPDIIYIHNPYDDMNRVTCVEPRFFAEELKKSGSTLVYVPYYVSGYCESYENMKPVCLTKGAIYSDFIVLQSEKLAEAYMYCGFYRRKLLVTGSPKIDCICRLREQPIEVRKEWKEAAEIRKVILLNSSLHALLNNQKWFFEWKGIISEVLKDQKIVVIWRPHPLLEQTIKSLRPECLGQYKEICQDIEKADNGFIDLEEDALEAISISDGLISDYSSLIMQYMYTGKPALILGERRLQNNSAIFCDYFANYFIEDGIEISDYINMIKEEKDMKKEERMKRANASLVNADGRCGVETHKAVLEKVCGTVLN